MVTVSALTDFGLAALCTDEESDADSLFGADAVCDAANVPHKIRNAAARVGLIIWLSPKQCSQVSRRQPVH